MLRREGRLGPAHLEPEPGEHHRPVVIHRWERPILLLAVIAMGMLVFIWGFDALTSVFR